MQRVKAAVAVDRRAGGLERAVGQDAHELDRGLAARENDGVRLAAHCKDVDPVGGGEPVKVPDLVGRVGRRAGRLEGAVAVDADQLDAADVRLDAAGAAVGRHDGVRAVAHGKGLDRGGAV